MIDRRPRLIARCADVADVIAAVDFGRQNDMLIAIRGGGHNAGGLGVCDDGLVIDLSLINYTRVDPAIELFVLEAAAPGMPSITRPMFLVSLCRRVSFRQLASVA